MSTTSDFLFAKSGASKWGIKIIFYIFIVHIKIPTEKQIQEHPHRDAPFFKRESVTINKCGRRESNPD